jgi:hypothetical protein
MPRRTHLAVVYLRKPKNRNATIVQCVVIKFRTHVNGVSDTRSNDLIHVSFGRNTSANGNAFGYEIERYGHGRMLRRRPLPVDLLEDFGKLVVWRNILITLTTLAFCRSLVDHRPSGSEP